jgi:hypothetical protein
MIEKIKRQVQRNKSNLNMKQNFKMRGKYGDRGRKT